MSHNLKNVQVSRDEKAWEVSIHAEIPAEVVVQNRQATLTELQKSAKLDGFRPGKAPIERIVDVYGESTILRQAAQRAVENELPKLLIHENIVVAEIPKVTVEPAGPEPLTAGFKLEARAPMMPEVKLPDYKAITASHPVADPKESEVTDAEHTEALTYLRRERARIEKVETGMEAQKAAEEARTMEENTLPELDDAFAQTLGYANGTEFTDAVRKNIGAEKTNRTREKRRAAILDALVAETKISYPAVMREFEKDDMEARLSADIARMGATLEAYLTEQKKTREELRASWDDAADKRARVRLILAHIARAENLEPEADVVDHELEHARQHYPDADAETLRANIRAALRNEMTLRFLEGNTEKVGHTADDHKDEHNH